MPLRLGRLQVRLWREEHSEMNYLKVYNAFDGIRALEAAPLPTFPWISRYTLRTPYQHHALSALV